MSERLTKSEQVGSSIDLDGLTLDKAIKELTLVKAQYEKDHGDEYYSFHLEFTTESNGGFRYDYDDTKRLYVYGVRKETDSEYDARMKQEEQMKDYRRQQYEALAKEFGNSAAKP